MDFKQLSLQYRQKLTEIGKAKAGSHRQWELIEEAKSIRKELNHVRAVGIIKRFTFLPV